MPASPSPPGSISRSARSPRSASRSPASGSSCGGASAATGWPWWRRSIVVLFYLGVIFADFLAYAPPTASEAQRSLLPPQRIHWFDEGRFSPHVFGLTGQRDPVTLKRVYTPDPTKKIRVRFFAPGFEYHFLGLIPANLHLARASRTPGRRRRCSSSARTSRAGTCGRASCTRRRTSLTIGLAGVALAPGAGGVPRRRLRLLRRRHRHRHPARHRDPAVDPDDPPLDGPGGGAPERLVGDPGLLRHHGDHLADRLDRAGPRGARAVPLAPRGGVRDGGRARRVQPDPDHPEPHGAVVPVAHHRGHDPGHSRP